MAPVVNGALRSRRDLRKVQTDFVDFMLGEDSTFGSVGMGLGKTAAALTAIADIIAEDRPNGHLRRFLVLGTKRICVNVWRQEAKQWEHLKHLRIGLAVGSPQQRLNEIVNPNADIVLMNYENLAWFWENIPSNQLPFYGLVMDEVDKLKDVGTKMFMSCRYRVHEFTWRLAMTGTPTPEHVHNVWSIAYLITSEKLAEQGSRRGPPAMHALFGSSKEIWMHKYFELSQYTHKVTPRMGTVDYIARELAPYTFVARVEDCPDMPEVVVNNVAFDLPSEAQKAYRTLEDELVLELMGCGADGFDGFDDDVDDASVVVPHRIVLKNKLRQLCSGFLYYDIPDPESDRPKRGTQWLHGAKLAAYREYASELMGEKHLAVYGFRAEADKLGFRDRLGGGMSARREAELLAEWNAGELDVLALHPASAGHGLNLQESGAYHIAFLTLPWSRGLTDQTIARLRRMGQRNSRVVVHRFIARGTVEEDVVAALEGKEEVQKQVIAALLRRAKR